MNPRRHGSCAGRDGEVLVLRAENQSAKIDAKVAGRELRDGDVKTACQQSCPASAIEFGDIRDGSAGSRRRRPTRATNALLEELNTKPRTTYLAKVRNPNPDLEERPGA